MKKRIDGIIPVMLTPFTDEGEIDYSGLERLIEWYLSHGSDALFAVCQSSEMQRLTLPERIALAKFVVRRVAGRVPVLGSGHVSDDLDTQIEELRAMSQTGVDAVVLVTNHLDPAQGGTEPFRRTLSAILDRLPRDLPLGLYECPAPYRRLLSDEELSLCAETGRFLLLKDVSCELATVKRRVAMTEGTPFAIVNANAAIAWDAMRAGSRGFCGVFTNVHPDLYQWLRTSSDRHMELARDLAAFLVLAAVTEALGYPALAKLYHQRIGTFRSIRCRVIDYDVRERFWALDAIVDKLAEGTERFRTRIRQLPGA
ncbi:MAG TPA: dihydrodipicolinate synthase family protein [Anaeromyxobacteraceae bacterium]|nr:dihydrodipicolinate synthase family protein [Anaeromyxobacteraceae bacterium]